MGYFYHDTDGGGSATAPYDTWAKAHSDITVVIGAMSAGDICFSQGSVADTAAVTRSLFTPGTDVSPCTFIACADGTTNEGTAITPSDLAADASLEITSTGSASSISIDGVNQWVGYLFTPKDKFNPWTTSKNTYINCKIKMSDDYLEQDNTAKQIFINTDIESNIQWSYIRIRNCTKWYGGARIETGSPVSAYSIYISDTRACFECHGVDWSGQQSTVIARDYAARLIQFVNCKMPASYTLVETATGDGFIEFIGSSDAGSVQDSKSIQDYTKASIHGTVDLQITNVRSNGADDGATGVFAYDLTPNINATVEGNYECSVKSPWMSLWVEGGTEITVTVHVANDSGADFNEDDMWCEWVTPDEGDTAAYDVTHTPNKERLVVSTTAVTDDFSTWAVIANPQKFSKTFTPGYTGFVQARVHFAKRYAASPKTLTVDPRIVKS
jgi:hypothetical protein